MLTSCKDYVLPCQKMLKVVNSLFDFLQTAPKEVGIAAVSWVIDTNWSAKLPLLISAELCKEIHKATIVGDVQADSDSAPFKMFSTLIREVHLRVFAKKSADASNCLRLLFLLYEFSKHKLQKSDAHLYAIMNSCSRSLVRKTQSGALQLDACISVRSAVLGSKCVIVRDVETKLEFDTTVGELLKLSSQCTENTLHSVFNEGLQLALIIEKEDIGTHKFLLLAELSGVCYHGTSECVLYFSSAISRSALKDAFESDIYPIRTFHLPIPGQEDQEVARRIKSEASICSMVPCLMAEGGLGPSMKFIVPYS